MEGGDVVSSLSAQGAVACRASGEVREIVFNPAPKAATK